MVVVKVSGNNRGHKIFLYALSTCVWCKRTKKFLKDNDLAFEYIDVDQSPLEEVRKIKKYLFDLKGKISYPTIIVDNKTLISGFQVDRLREVLEL